MAYSHRGNEPSLAATPFGPLRPRTLRPQDRRRGQAQRGEPKALDARFESARALALTPLDEARSLQALAFSELPLPTVLELEVPGWSGPVWVRSAPERAASDRAGLDRAGSGRGASVGPTTDPVIDGAAWRALAIAVASDRARPCDLRALLAALAAAPQQERASVATREIEGWMDSVAPSACTLRVGQVLERLGARLFSVRIEDDVEEHAANGPPIAWAG